MLVNVDTSKIILSKAILWSSILLSESYSNVKQCLLYFKGFSKVPLVNIAVKFSNKINLKYINTST